ncbi:hypothetical protein BCR44DRAFT_1464757 [Catenaria anguillulae PL171]|uniref:Uncharacterized protein n=1 Tax=Catenaria anguillulae PL171 TaxID=765915 RepID=A0A1Y2H6Y2_9FUNG|nr:hypothetical protein BCR44DRAFT_1464757 [Catenaria anguillulae PL171]
MAVVAALVHNRRSVIPLCLHSPLFLPHFELSGHIRPVFSPCLEELHHAPALALPAPHGSPVQVTFSPPFSKARRRLGGIELNVARAPDTSIVNSVPSSEETAATAGRRDLERLLQIGTDRNGFPSYEGMIVEAIPFYSEQIPSASFRGISLKCT